MFAFKYINESFNLEGELFSLTKNTIQIEINGDLKPVLLNSIDNVGYEIKIKGTEIEGVLNVGSFLGQLTLELNINNTGDHKITLGKCYFIKQAALRLSPDNSEILILQSGTCGFNKNIHLNQVEESEKAVVFSTINKTGVGGLSCGFATFDRAFCEVEYEKVMDANETSLIYNDIEAAKPEYAVSVYCDFNSFLLEPGKSLSTETFFIEENVDSFTLLDNFADAVKTRYNINCCKTMPVGWVGGWNFREGFFVENIEKLTMQNIDVINERLAGFGVKYIWVSTLNLKENLPGNWDLDNKYNFPYGLKYMSDYCKKNGLGLGLWFSPFWMNEASENLSEVENAIAVKDGKKVITEFGFSTHQPFGDKEREELSRNYYLDPTHPDLHEFLKKVFTYYNEIGISYFMVDFLVHGIDRDYDLFDKSVINGPESLRTSMKVIRETADENTYLLSSSGPTYYNIGVCDGVRAGLDFGEGRPFLKYYNFYPANYLSNNFKLIEKVMRDYALTYFNHKKLYVNDCFNMLSIGQPISKNEARVVCSMFGLAANPLMLGDDLPSLKDERLQMIKKLLPLHEGSWIPCDLFETTYPDTPCVFTLVIEKHYDSYVIISVFNYGIEPLAKTINLYEFFGDEECFVYDFWDEHCLGKTNGSFMCHVPPRDVKVLRISKARMHPWVIGSDMHITQGDAELSHLRWNPKNLTLKGVCKRPRGERGSLFINIPKGYEPVDFRELFLVQEVEQDLHIIDSLVVEKDDIMNEKISSGKETEKLIIGLKKLYFDVETTDFNIAFRYNE